MNGFFNKNFDGIGPEDIQYLMMQKVAEKQNLEYKSQAYGRADDDTREMLRDFTSLANAFGGYLLIGIDEDTDGLPTSLRSVENAEEERDRILSILLSTIEPRIPGLQAKTLVVNGNAILLFYVPKSHRAPHLITFKGLNQFWIRHDRQKSKMSVDEIRDVFIKTENLIRDIKEFLDQRKKEVLGEIGAIPYYIIGVVPLLHPGHEIVNIRDENLRKVLIEGPNQRYTGWSFNFEGYGRIRPTLNGLMAYLPNAEKWKTLELYRNGHFEAKILIDDNFCRESAQANLSNGKPGRSLVLSPYALAGYPLSFFHILKRLKEHLGIEEDYIAFASLFNIQDYGLKRHRPEASGYSDGEISIWDKRHLEIATVQCNLTRSADDLAREFADRIWQAFGYEGCPMFQNGIFKPSG